MMCTSALTRAADCWACPFLLISTLEVSSAATVYVQGIIHKWAPLFIVSLRIQSSYSALQRINQDLEEKIHRNVSLWTGVCVFQSLCTSCSMSSRVSGQLFVTFEDGEKKKIGEPWYLEMIQSTLESQFEYECPSVGTTDVNYGLLQLAVLLPTAEW